MEWIWPLVALAAIVWFGRRVRRRAWRQRRLMELCERAGLDFAPLDPDAEATWVPHPIFAHTRMGTENVVWDRHADDGIRVFDLWTEDSTERRREPRRWSTCAVIPLPCSCPRLTVDPCALDEPTTWFGEEIRLELDAFDRRFRVGCEDRRFAFAFLDQRMMEALLGLPDDVALDANEDVAVLRAPLLPPERVLLLHEVATLLRRHVPRVVADLYPRRPIRGAHERRWLQGRYSEEPTGDASAVPSRREDEGGPVR